MVCCAYAESLFLLFTTYKKLCSFERVAVVDEPLAKPDKRVPAMEEQLAKKGKHVDEDDGGMIYRRGGSLSDIERKFRDNGGAAILKQERLTIFAVSLFRFFMDIASLQIECLINSM